MRVELEALRAESGASLVVEYGETITSGLPDLPFVGPVKGTVTLTNLGPVLGVDGRLEVQIEIACDRCARRFHQRLEAEVQERIDWNEARVRADRGEGGGLEGETGFLVPTASGQALEVERLARELLASAIPMIALCRQDCPGLCDRCGADLGTCACGPMEEQIDPRLRALAALSRREPDSESG